MQLFMQPHAGLQEIMQLYEAGRKFNISQILLPMPDYIAALPWEGKNARALLAELYITEGPANIQKAALTKLLDSSGDLHSVPRQPQSVDVAFILKRAFPTSLPGSMHYLRHAQVPQLCYQSASDVLSHLCVLVAAVDRQSNGDLAYSLAESANNLMHIKMAPEIKYHPNQGAAGRHTPYFATCIWSLIMHKMQCLMNPPGIDWPPWSGHFSCDDLV